MASNAAAGKSLLLIVVSPAIVGNILARHGTDAQNNRWTSVERRGERLVLNGQKTYISGVEHSDAVLVVARCRTARSDCPRSRSWMWTHRASRATRSRCSTWARTSSGRCSSTTCSSRRSA